MEPTTVAPRKSCETSKKKLKTKFNLRYLRISLKYRPEILKLVLSLRETNRRKTALVKRTAHKLELMVKYLRSLNEQGYKLTVDSKIATTETSIKQMTRENYSVLTDTIAKDVHTSNTKTSSTQTKKRVKNCSTQTDYNPDNSSSKNSSNIETASRLTDKKDEPVAWDLKDSGDGKSIADQVKEAAQSAMQQSGMVYVETAGMYYDYKTGYYYNSELGLYYHPDTGCYYCYSEDKKEFAFHSYPDRQALAANASLLAHEKRKAKKLKKEEEEASKPKRKKKAEEKQKSKGKTEAKGPKMDVDKDVKDTNSDEKERDTENKVEAVVEGGKETENNVKGEASEVKIEDLEDGECSETASEGEQSDGEESDASTASVCDDDTIAKHHPPCMRVVVRETKLPKLKVGSLFLVTKDGGTIGREGDQHAILIKDQNVSRNHLDIRYDLERRLYLATDLGSKNGTLLNGIQMSESLVVSQPMEVIHGSIIQLGETKLLCHIHPGNDTCGHCEPGLIMETLEKEKVAYTRTCSVKKQYELELARLKNRYAPEPLMIEEGTYNDRAKARRETVGSSHHSEKTESTDVDTFIAPENKGFKLLEKMGWAKGEGLGKESQGNTEPVPILSNEGTAGLGTGAVGAPKPQPPKPRNKLGSSTLRLAARSKLLQPPAKAFQNPLDDDDDE